MRILPIASSSDGNCTWIESGKSSILIDCGVTLKALRGALGEGGLKSLDAIFITHEHYDHVKSLEMISRRYPDLPVYINALSYSSLNGRLNGFLRRPLENGVEVIVGKMSITPFPLKHDTSNTFGFSITGENGTNLCYLTDTGQVDFTALDYLEDSESLFIETNYDEILLERYQGYPEFLKNRIKQFHMGNRQTLDLLDNMGIEKFNNIICAHLSPRSNSRLHLRKLIEDRFPEVYEKFSLAPFREPLELDMDQNHQADV